MLGGEGHQNSDEPSWNPNDFASSRVKGPPHRCWASLRVKCLEQVGELYKFECSVQTLAITAKLARYKVDMETSVSNWSDHILRSLTEMDTLGAEFQHQTPELSPWACPVGHDYR